MSEWVRHWVKVRLCECSRVRLVCGVFLRQEAARGHALRPGAAVRA